MNLRRGYRRELVERRPSDKLLATGILGSLLIHATLLYFMGLSIVQKRIEVEKGKKVFDVSFTLPPLKKSVAAPKKKALNLNTSRPQAVTEPKSRVIEETNSSARFLAEKNRVAEREQIKRGDDPLAGPVVGPDTGADTPGEKGSGEKAPPREEVKPRTKQPPKKLSSLRLSDHHLKKEFSDSPTKRGKTLKPARELLETPSSPDSYRAFSRPSGSGARFLGRAGSADFLPNLPDGDITLLNTKASKFAVFVRRVATRVFSKLRASGWESLAPGDIHKMKKFSTVKAILSPEGNLLKVELMDGSGSRGFDRVLLAASKAGASDPHPPEGALASDGNIHFIFKARSWSQVGPSRGGKGVAEKRWLLLSTGLG